MFSVLRPLPSYFRVTLTNGSIVLRSLILFPLRLRCVRLGHFSARTSNPPEILLSLSSSCENN